jgi:hypothetical protein
MLKPYRSKNSLTVIWQGDVEVFHLTGNKLATRAYTWTASGLDDTQAKRHVAVLHVPPIDLSQAAVRAGNSSVEPKPKNRKPGGPKMAKKIGT